MIRHIIIHLIEFDTKNRYTVKQLIKRKSPALISDAGDFLYLKYIITCTFIQSLNYNFKIIELNNFAYCLIAAKPIHSLPV